MFGRVVDPYSIRSLLRCSNRLRCGAAEQRSEVDEPQGRQGLQPPEGAEIDPSITTVDGKSSHWQGSLLARCYSSGDDKGLDFTSRSSAPPVYSIPQT